MEDFYARVPPFDDFARVADPSVYVDVPSDWWILLTDVQGSTKAIEAGRYKDVNAVGASVIMAVRNLTEGRDLPYVFGGDGATVLVPPELREVAARAGAATAKLAEQAFDMRLRVGLVPVADLHAAGHALRVARYRLSPHVTLAMLEGGGARYADALVKSPDTGPRYAVPVASEIEPKLYAGFECRWRPLLNRNGLMLSVLVVALGDEPTQLATYRRVLRALAPMLEPDRVRPVRESNAHLNHAPLALDTESRVRTGARSLLARLGYLLKGWLLTCLGTVLMMLKTEAAGFDGAVYKAHVVANTDFRKFDDALRMVVDVSPAQRDAVLELLKAERADGTLAYGTHSADAALMTCYVPTYDRFHLHFVDGADGGYALAACGLKAQLAEGPD